MSEREERRHAEPPSQAEVLEAVVEFVDELVADLDAAAAASTDEEE